MSTLENWSESFSPRGVDRAVTMQGPGGIEDFLARGAYAAAGGFAAETIHDWAVSNKDEYSFLESMAEETVGLGMVVFVAYATEKWVWKANGAKIFTAGMAGRYGGAFWDMLKGFLTKKKAQGGVIGGDEEGSDLSMDKSRKVSREIGRVLRNSPQSLDRLAEMMAAGMAKSPDFKDVDPSALRSTLREGFGQTAETLAAA